MKVGLDMTDIKNAKNFVVPDALPVCATNKIGPLAFRLSSAVLDHGKLYDSYLK